jgi:hypothetical protein
MNPVTGPWAGAVLAAAFAFSAPSLSADRSSAQVFHVGDIAIIGMAPAHTAQSLLTIRAFRPTRPLINNKTTAAIMGRAILSGEDFRFPNRADVDWRKEATEAPHWYVEDLKTYWKVEADIPCPTGYCEGGGPGILLSKADGRILAVYHAQ